MSKIQKIGLAGVAALAFAAPALAHHSTAMFDSSKTIEVQGTVKEFQYTNPHSWLIVDVENEDGTMTSWGFEAEGPGTLMRRQIGKNTLPVGMEVTVRGNPHVDGRPAAAWVDVTLADGTVLSPRGQ